LNWSPCEEVAALTILATCRWFRIILASRSASVIAGVFLSQMPTPIVEVIFWKSCFHFKSRLCCATVGSRDHNARHDRPVVSPVFRGPQTEQQQPPHLQNVLVILLNLFVASIVSVMDFSWYLVPNRLHLASLNF